MITFNLLIKLAISLFLMHLTGKFSNKKNSLELFSLELFSLELFLSIQIMFYKSI